MATPHNYRPTGFVGACLHILRHLAQVLLGGRQPAGVELVQSDEKSVGAIERQ